LKEILPQPGKRTDLEPGAGADTKSEVARRAGLYAWSNEHLGPTGVWRTTGITSVDVTL
jgi:hypothetical protein